MTIEKHNILGIRKYLSKKFQGQKVIPNSEFERAMSEFNLLENEDFVEVSRTNLSNKNRVKVVYENSKKQKIERIVEDDLTITAYSLEEDPKVRPKKGFWGNLLGAEGDKYFNSREDRIKARSNMSRWQQKLEEEENK